MGNADAQGLKFELAPHKGPGMPTVRATIKRRSRSAAAAGAKRSSAAPSVTQNPTHLAPAGTPAVRQTRTLLASLLRAGIPLALGSDARGAESNPWFNMMLALRNGAPGEQLSREQALFAYTAGGAHAERQEARRGRIAIGYAADLALPSQDVLVVPITDLPETKNLLTLVDGEVVYEAPELRAAQR